MKLREIYRFAVEAGIEADPRGKIKIKKELDQLKKKYEKMDKEEKVKFDLEKLSNPFSDTRILFGDENCEIKNIFVGIDMQVGEILLAKFLKKQGKKIDLILSHHPEGKALAGFFEVMPIHIAVLHKVGVPINVAEGIMSERIKEVERSVLPINHMRAVAAARLLNIPFMCIHTPVDNLVNAYLQKIFDQRKCETLKDIMNVLEEIPEYEFQVKNNIAGPKIVAGSKENKTGKVLVEMTGGTGGPKTALSKLVQAGVGTIVGMHIKEENLKEAQKHHLNVIIAGHISSDSIGLNLFLDRLQRKGKLNILGCSGFERIKRTKVH